MSARVCFIVSPTSQRGFVDTASGPTGMPAASAGVFRISGRRARLGEHRRAPHHEGAEHSAGEEAARVVVKTMGSLPKAVTNVERARATVSAGALCRG